MFEKGNLNRIWAILGAIEDLERPTITTISEAVSMPRPTVSDAMRKLVEGQVPFVKVTKIESVYRIEEWLDTRSSISNVYNAACANAQAK